MINKDVISVENMRQSDAYTIENFTDSKTLMYNAAMGVYNSVQWKGKIAIVSGSGNNGGDGYALACILADNGISSTVITVSEKFSEDGAYYAEKAKEKSVEFISLKKIDSLNEYDIIVDCILGTGFKGEIRGSAKRAVDMINESYAYVVSVDINSGLNGDSGQAVTAVKSDLTVSIGYLKTGMFLCDAPEFIKSLTNADIGIRLLKKQYALSSYTEPQSFKGKKYTEKDFYKKYNANCDSIIEKGREATKNEQTELLIYNERASVLFTPDEVCFSCNYLV